MNQKRKKAVSVGKKLLTFALGCIISYWVGVRHGSNYVYQEFQSGECWTNKTSLDVECVKYIGK